MRFGKHSEQAPYYHLVPKTPLANLRFRREIVHLALSSEKFADDLWLMCKRDILFFINTFGWLLEPRKESGSKVIPFITRDYETLDAKTHNQDEVILGVAACIGIEDFIIDKSRATGATWIMLYVYTWRWLFREYDAFGLVSRNADAVDKSDNPDALMQKIDFILDERRFPSFLRPNFRRSLFKFFNVDKDTTINGYAATGDIARGGRLTAVSQDEFAFYKPGEDYEANSSTQHVTNCRGYISTPNKPRGAHYDILQEAESRGIKKFVMDWKDDPEKRAGLYTSAGEKVKVLEILDKGHAFPEDYPFILDGRTRSIYYDKEWNRAGATPNKIDRELDRKFGGAGSLWFDSRLIERLQRVTASEPWSEGRLIWDEETIQEIEFSEVGGGPLKLWTTVDPVLGSPPANCDYSVGADIAAGTGGEYSSNSTLFVTNSQTGEQVAQLVINTMSPLNFARMAVAVCRWFKGPAAAGAYLVFEFNGPSGAQFAAEIKAIGYENVYYRYNMDSVGKVRSKKAGFFTSLSSKPNIFGKAYNALETGSFIVRSRETLEECTQYIYSQGIPVHVRSLATDDESSKGKAHGDRVMGMVLSWHGVQDRPPPKREEERKSEPPLGSMGQRLADMDQREKEENENLLVFD